MHAFTTMSSEKRAQRSCWSAAAAAKTLSGTLHQSFGHMQVMNAFMRPLQPFSLCPVPGVGILAEGQTWGVCVGLISLMGMVLVFNGGDGLAAAVSAVL